MSEPTRARSSYTRRLVVLLLAIPACGAAYWAGMALGPSRLDGSTKYPPHIQPINRLTDSS